MKDIHGNNILVGDRVACAFSNRNRASIRLGVVEDAKVIFPYFARPDIETYKIKCRWDNSGTLSPWIDYQYPERWIRI